MLSNYTKVGPFDARQILLRHSGLFLACIQNSECCQGDGAEERNFDVPGADVEFARAIDYPTVGCFSRDVRSTAGVLRSRRIIADWFKKVRHRHDI